MTRAADAFAAELQALGIDVADLDERFGQRAALLAASDLLWKRALGPLVGTAEVQVLLGVSRQAVNERVHRHRLLALPRADGRPGLRFPLFQFRGGEVLPGIADVLSAFLEAAVSLYTIASWLQAPEPELDGRTPLELLNEGEVEPVVTVALHRGERLRY